MAAKNKTPGSKNDAKTSIIVALVIVVIIQAFMLFHKEKPRVAKKQLPVAVKPYVPITPVKPAKPIKPSVKPVVTPDVVVPATGLKIAFVLDDWGYTMQNCKILSEIKEPLAIAILPNLRHTKNIAACADAAGKVVMLHLPMEPYHNNDRYPDNYLINGRMRPSQAVKILDDALTQLPMVKGVNNHMGSKATEDRSLMKVLLKDLKRRNLFFMDSMTSPHHSVCGEVAAQQKVDFIQRDVFLDNINTPEAIRVQFKELVQKARRKGYAVAIGHDRELTLRMIKEQIPLLEALGFEIVSVKELVKDQ